MKMESHQQLGKTLLREYLPELPPCYASAFLLGCFEPDQNPTTYLKGSLRHQMLRGHNYANASHYIHRLFRRLEKRRNYRLLDYYTLGKLVHYVADSFTQSHNTSFPTSLVVHRAYENELQAVFLTFLQHPAPLPQKPSAPLTAFYQAQHAQYLRSDAGAQTDAVYTYTVCSAIVRELIAKNQK